MLKPCSPPLVFLVDAFGLIFQVFHAVDSRMQSPKGIPTNALFGFTRDMISIYQDVAPDYLIVVFDGEKRTFRQDIYTEYKANRTAMPEELTVQFPAMRQMLEGMNIPCLVEEGYEADDVIATVATNAAELGWEVYICTSDKDCRQLIKKNVRLYNLRKRQTIDLGTLKEDWGVTPEQVIDLQTLVGDSVDNVPGVPGVGLKTAAKLLQEYGTLENLVANVKKVKGPKRQAAIEESLPNLERTRQLVRLKTNVPMKLDWEGWRRKPLNVPKLSEMFREWGFNSFTAQVQHPLNDLLEDDQRNGVETSSESGKTSPAKSKWEPGQYYLVDTEHKLAALLTRLAESNRLAVDLETTSTNPMQAEIVGYAFSTESKIGWYVPVKGPEGCAILDGQTVISYLKPILEDPKREKINQNIKYDLLVLRQHGIRLQNCVGDPMIAAYLLNAGERNHNLQHLARTYLNHEVIPITALIGKAGPKQLGMHQVDTAKVTSYAGEDADVAWRLCDRLEEELRNSKLWDLYADLEIPLIEVLAELEGNGICLDVTRLQELDKFLTAQIDTLESTIYELAGEEFNIGSLKQLRRILFEQLGLKPVKRTPKGEPSTDQETLERLAAESDLELPKHLLEHRRLSKLKSTYIDTLPELVHADTGRVHASFNQTVTATGRLSSSDPNLQNIPIRSDLGGQIRQAFVACDGWQLVMADYSQIELRLLAHFSQDEELCRAYEEDRDIHTLVAAQIHGVNEDQVSSQMRRVAKTVNFGVIYGMSARGLSQRLQIPNEDAEQFISEYFQRYPKVLKYQDELLGKCRKDGYVATILGRRRSFHPDAIRANSTYSQRNQAEREAINMQIQGSAADLIKVAMLNIFRRLRNENRQTRLLLQIHDELVFESPPAEIESVAFMISQEMQQALKTRLRVPLKVDVQVGSNWLDTKEFKV
ncbi:MAG: DNA polymerase I [Gemmataceae bacterium]